MLHTGYLTHTIHVTCHGYKSAIDIYYNIIDYIAYVTHRISYPYNTCEMSWMSIYIQLYYCEEQVNTTMFCHIQYVNIL